MAQSARPSDGAPARSPAGPGRPQSFGHQNGLDGLRLLAALAVILYHIPGFTGPVEPHALGWRLVARGEVGVPIFFVLSGLLLFRPWVKRYLLGAPRPAVRSYLWRRALRIMPAYWIVAIIAIATLGHGKAKTQWDWTEVLLLLHIYDPKPWYPATYIGPRGLGQIWSLAVEVSFYMVLPLLAAVIGWLACRRTDEVDRRARTMLICLGVLSLIPYAYLWWTYHPFRPQHQVWLPHYIGWFAAGMAISVVTVWAQAASRGGRTIRRFCETVAGSPLPFLLVAVVAYAVAATPIGGPKLGMITLGEHEVKLALYTVVALFLVAPVAFQPREPTPLTRFFGNPVMRFLGKISYGIFLWQFLVLYGFYNATDRDLYAGGFVLVLLVTLAGSIACATASYYLIETPLQKLRTIFDDPIRPAGPQDPVPVDRALRAAERKDSAHP